MKVIFSGLEGCGKSYKLAEMAVQLLYRNAKWNKITGKSRPIVSNMQFAEAFRTEANLLGVELRYWKDLDELVLLTEADIICDEVGNYFDSRMWADLSLDVRRWLTQGSKMGIEFYGGAQDFAQVDKAFRRLVQVGDLLYITKLIGSRRPSATKPPVKRIWGICAVRKLNPLSYDEDEKEFSGGLVPSFFFLRKSVCEIFDTGQKIVRSAPPKMKHIQRVCELDRCGVVKIQHV